MTRAHFVKKARKDYPEDEIKKGDSYWYWSFAFGPKYKSKTKPTRSQLTRSEFLSTLWAIEDDLDERFKEMSSSEDIENAIEELKSEIEQLRDETQGKLDNMPEQLQYADSGQLLQERIEGLDSWISDLDSVDTNVDEDLKGDDKTDRIQEIIDEITSTSSGL